MNKTITLQDAIEAWARIHSLPSLSGDHLGTEQLYEWLMQTHDSGLSEERLHHLVRCPRCLAELKSLSESRREARDSGLELWDVALAKAASSKIKWPKKFVSESKKYTLEIRSMLNNDDRGVIVVQVGGSDRTKLEGMTLCVKDRTGRVLLRGQIIGGEVTQLIERGLKEVVPHFYIHVEP